MLALLVLALAAPVTASPVTSPGTPAPAAASPAPAAKPLPPVVINGVLFRAVEFDTAKVVWRNLAVTVTADRLAAWRALPEATKRAYADQMIATYRAGMKFEQDIKLSFIDEQNATLDQYLWTAPLAEGK